MKQRLRTIFLVVMGGLWIIFILQNTELVTVRFLMFEVSMSRVILLIITTLIGFTFGYMVHFYRQRQAKKQSSA